MNNLIRAPRVSSGNPELAKDNDRWRQKDPVMQRYHDVPWRKLTVWLKVLNPLCARIRNDGLYRKERCHHAAFLIHHRISPRSRPDLFLRVFDENNVSNLIPLCSECHPPTEGSPDWKEGVHFVRTEWRTPKV